MDLFLTLGSIFFAVEILHRAYGLYQIIVIRLLIREHEDCEECIEQEIIKEIRKK